MPRMRVFVSSSVLATVLGRAAGGPALASTDSGNGGNGGNGGSSFFGNGGNGGAGGNGSWAGGNGCGSFFCNHPTGVSRCSPGVTWCGAPRGVDLAQWLSGSLFSPQLLNELPNLPPDSPFQCPA